MKTRLVLTILATAGLLVTPAIAAEPTAVLKAYEAVSTALANDDLGSAKTGAADLATKAKAEGQEAIAQHADALAKSTSLDQAREHFRMISAEAVKLADKAEGYHVVQCPMADAKWVQSGEKVMNPYMGKKMQQCGEMMGMMKGMQGKMDGAEGGCMRCCSMMG